jgi:hypothetical protein
MKSVIVMPALTMMFMNFGFGARAQAGNPALSPLLDKYYAIKNALVAGDAAAASKHAADFAAALSAVHASDAGTKEASLFASLKPSLAAESAKISGTKDIARQREAFAVLSQQMISLARGAKLSDKAVYVDYCPMKKSSWLSAEQAIRNPYYGSSMLTCGKVTDTLQ